MKINDFVARYPRLYHMAEAGTWPLIQQFGLLSTSAILDLHKVNGHDRAPFESEHRPEMMNVASGHAPAMALRDQKPMSDARLEMALNGSSTPKEWYELLNQRVFMWATEDRLLTLLSAKHYRETLHDVMTIDSAKLLTDYADKIELCHMNSGNTFPIPHHRTPKIFQLIRNYVTRASGLPVKEVAEVTVPYGIPNIMEHVICVESRKGAQVINTIYKRNR